MTLPPPCEFAACWAQGGTPPHEARCAVKRLPPWAPAEALGRNHADVARLRRPSSARPGVRTKVWADLQLKPAPFSGCGAAFVARAAGAQARTQAVRPRYLRSFKPTGRANGALMLPSAEARRGRSRSCRPTALAAFPLATATAEALRAIVVVA
eukprot:CAMPEP_0170371814 /NCGR_PEP_ID=MMETSP0117_2-20130122/9227_1 /TAXON_ID=400756 /ORGANISM="Durinskia baltica, Strain CSIRO CS-38" /LENGTH=153 /DNA_ID=CAMNT_0010626645 /DNA_START=22 /DNA_END=481 /DNA_ORIENTATION=+